MAAKGLTFAALPSSSMACHDKHEEASNARRYRVCCGSMAGGVGEGGIGELRAGVRRMVGFGSGSRVCSAMAMSEGAKFGAAIKSDEYNEAMKRKMMNPYEYHHELGMYYTMITENLIVGSQPQSVDDIQLLHSSEKVTTILNLQQDKDIEYWGIELTPILQKCDELGIQHKRRPAKDFDPDSLRRELPSAVAALEKAISSGGTVYVHCTAGLGRAPAVAIAYLFWFQDMDMESAYKFVTSKRPCGPKREAIRGATYDLATNDPWKEAFEELPGHAFTDIAEWERKLIQERVRSLG